MHEGTSSFHPIPLITPSNRLSHPALRCSVCVCVHIPRSQLCTPALEGSEALPLPPLPAPHTRTQHPPRPPPSHPPFTWCRRAAGAAPRRRDGSCTRPCRGGSRWPAPHTGPLSSAPSPRGSAAHPVLGVHVGPRPEERPRHRLVTPVCSLVEGGLVVLHRTQAPSAASHGARAGSRLTI